MLRSVFSWGSDKERGGADHATVPPRAEGGGVGCGGGRGGGSAVGSAVAK